LAKHLFTYGSLVVPAVMQAVTRFEHRHRKAHLAGFERFMLVERIYPGIVESAGGKAPGRVYFDLGDDAFERLDFFESDEYRRQRVRVQVEDGALVSAFAYVIRPSHMHLISNQPWDEEAFVATEMPDFLERTRQWMDEFVGSDR